MCKRTACLFLTFFVLTSFLINATAQEPVEPPPETADPEVIMTAVQNLHDAFNAHDMELWKTYITDDIVLDAVPSPPPVSGKEEAAAFFGVFIQGFPDLYGNLDKVLISGNIAIAQTTMTGTHLAEWAGIAPTGSEIQMMVLEVMEFEGDKEKRATFYWDMSSMLMQLGVMPASELDPALLVPSFTLPDPEPTGLAPLEAYAEQTARWNSTDLSHWAEMIHRDADLFIGPLGIPMNRDAYIAFQELYLLGFPDREQENIHVVDLGDGWVLAEMVFTGTNDGPYFGIPATGLPVTMRAGQVSHFDADGLLTYQYSYFDNITILTQLGLFPPPSETEANKELVRRYIEEVWNQQNVELVGEFVSPDVAGYLPEGEFTGIEGVVQHVTGSLAAFPDFNITIEEMIAEGDKVSARITARGTHEGALLGLIPPTGKQVVLTGIFIFQIADSKIVGAWSMADMLGVMQQIGVIPSDRVDFSWGEPSEVTGAPGDLEANKAIVVRDIEEVWHQGKLDIIEELYAPGYVYHMVGSPFEIRGPEGYRQMVAMYLTAFPDVRFTFEDIFTEGDKVILRWASTGTHTSEFMGIAPTGVQVKIKGISIERIADGKIVEAWTIMDQLGLMQQLGVIPPMGPPHIPEELVVDQITSLSLEDNLLGDPATREVVIYLPPSYDKGGRFPVVYLLHGYTGNARTFVSDAFTGLYWPANNDFPQDGLYGMLNDMIAAGKLNEMIVVMPDGSNKYGGSWYTNSELTGNYEDYIVNDLVSYIDSNYRTIPSRDSRAIIGHSMGGYGAMKLAMKHPDVFGAVATLSGGISFEGMTAFIPLVIAENPDGFTGPSPDKPLTSITYSMAAAFSPNLGNPPFFVDIPYEYPTGSLIKEIWDKWMSHDVLTMLTPYASNLSSMRGIYIDSGDQDEFGTAILAEAAHGVLATAGVEHKYEIYSGTHFSRLFERLGIAMKFFSDKLVAEYKEGYTNVFFASLSPGLNMISLPLKSMEPYTARSFAEEIGATVVIGYDTTLGRFVGFTLDAPDDGFPIEGGEGYIVNVPEGGTVAFTGAAWTNEPPVAAAPSAQTSDAWAFVVSGSVLDGEGMSVSDGEYTVTVKNLRTGALADETVGESRYFAAAYADLSRKAVVEAGDKVEVAVIDSRGKVVSGPFVHDITLDGIRDAVVKVQLRLGDIIPEKSALLQNYPNPFNPETWIPFHLKGEASVSIRIFNLSGQLIKTLDLGNKDAGVYVSRTKAACWDGKNEAGEEVASGIYFYSITAGDFSATKKMIIRK